MPLLETKGAASAQGFGGAGAGASEPVTYIEDVFSTWLYTGNDSTQTITNGIDLSGKGGLVWIKNRAMSNYGGHYLRTFNPNSGKLDTSWDGAQNNFHGLITPLSSGFDITGSINTVNENGISHVSWTFRKQPKFFDIVTYTGNGVAGRTVSHSLGAVPGCMIIKRTSSAGSWIVYHRSLGNTKAMELQTTGVAFTDTVWNNTTPTSTVFTLGGASIGTNDSGSTYVAYLFAHDAGGFGLTGTDNVISCGSYTGNGLTDGPVINLSYEPQWVMIKRTDSTGDWALIDNMRGFPDTGSAGNYDNGLLANTSGAETTTSLRVKPTSTGFSPVGGDAGTNASGGTYIYIAIRRGPMKVPTSGTSVYVPSTTASSTNISVGFPSDLWIGNNRDGTGGSNAHTFASRLTGTTWLKSASTAAETTGGLFYWDLQNSFLNDQFGGSRIEYFLRRAPGFFDVVCYTGTGVARTVNHNLGVAPELMLICRRSGGVGFMAYSANYGTSGYSILNTTEPFSTTYWGSASIIWNNTAPTSSVFSLGTSGTVNNSAATYVAYLFATCPGVSKVGSYTGNGSNQTINCGFTGGARFVLIKRTDSTGDWYVWDTARGIIAGNDPHLSLNTTAAEVTTNDSIDTDSTGFIVNELAATNINVSSATYIFLAIA